MPGNARRNSPTCGVSTSRAVKPCVNRRQADVIASASSTSGQRGSAPASLRAAVYSARLVRAERWPDDERTALCVRPRRTHPLHPSASRTMIAVSWAAFSSPDASDGRQHSDEACTRHAAPHAPKAAQRRFAPAAAAGDQNMSALVLVRVRLRAMAETRAMDRSRAGVTFCAATTSSGAPISATTIITATAHAAWQSARARVSCGRRSPSSSRLQN